MKELPAKKSPEPPPALLPANTPGVAALPHGAGQEYVAASGERHFRNRCSSRLDAAMVWLSTRQDNLLKTAELRSWRILAQQLEDEGPNARNHKSNEATTSEERRALENVWKLSSTSSLGMSSTTRSRGKREWKACGEDWRHREVCVCV